MYFLREGATELGKELIYINENEVCRRIIYNQPAGKDNEGYQILYSEDFNKPTGLDFKAELLSKDDRSTMYFDHIDSKDLNKREIDTDNLVEFCVNIMNTQALPSGMSVSQGSPMEISLYGNDDTIKDFQFIPEKDGTVFHLKDTMIYTNYIVSDEKKERTFSEHPIFYKDNILAKVVYTKKLLINKDYNIPNEILIFDNANLILNIKYDRVTEIDMEDYKLTRAVPVYAKCRQIVTDTCRPSDTFDVNKYIQINEKLSVESGTTDNVIISCENLRNGWVKGYNILYPIHYVSILGNIFMDELHYKIYAEEEIVYEDGKLRYHNISYHRLDKNTLSTLKKFVK